MPCDDVSEIRRHFRVAQEWIFLDHAAVSPPCDPARNALITWANDVAANGVACDPRWLERIEEARSLAGRLIGAEPEDIAFLKNTSEGIGIVAEGYRWRDGDNVVIAEDEYPANVYPWLNLQRRGVEVRRVPSRQGRIRVDEVMAAVDNRTRVISISFVEFATGFRNDLDAIGELCRERDIFFFVDAIQGLGAIPLDIRQTPIDALAADGHKWLLAYEGAAIFYVRRNWIDRLEPVDIGWNSVVGAWEFDVIDFRLKPHAGRYESGTYNTGGIAALGASLDLLMQIGIDRIWDRVRSLTDHLCDRASDAGIRVYSSREERDKSGIVSLDVGSTDLKKLVSALRDRRIVVNRRGGRLRVSPHCYNTVDEIDRFVSELKGLLRQ